MARLQFSADRVGLAVALSITVLWWPANWYPGDTGGMMLEGESIAYRGELRLDTSTIDDLTSCHVCYRNVRTGDWYSKFGVMSGAFFAPAFLMERALVGLGATQTARLRVVLLNVWNTFLVSVLVCAARRWFVVIGASAFIANLTVLATLFGTFVFHYLRAQTSELLQAVFVILWLLAASTAARTAQNTNAATFRLAGAWLSLVGLVLTKFVFVSLAAAFALLALALPRAGLVPAAISTRPRWSHVVNWALLHGLPLLCLGVALGAVHDIKFGHPTLLGYEQAAADTRFSFWQGLVGFAVDARKGLVWNAPLLLLTAAALPRLIRGGHYHALVGPALMAAMVIQFAAGPGWHGDWSYGPRYLVPMVVPAMAGAAIFAERCVREGGWRLACLRSAGLAFVLIGGLMQVQQNRFHFFLYWVLRNSFSMNDPATATYFTTNHDTLVTLGIELHYQGVIGLTWLDEALRGMPPETQRQVLATLAASFRTFNLFWFAAQ